MECRKRRIVAVPLSAVGHATPMMHLCSYLSSKGFSITFVTVGTALHLKQMIEQGGTWPPPGSDIDVVEISIEDEAPEFVNWRQSLVESHRHTRKHAGELEKLVKGIEEGVSVLISEYQYSWAYEVAVKLGIPTAVLFTGNATWAWFELNLPRLASEGLIPDKDELLAEEEDTVLCEEPMVLRRSDIPWHFWDGKEFRAFNIGYNVKVWEQARWLLINTSEALEAGMIQAMKQRLGERRYLAVGPLLLANEERNAVGMQEVNRDCVRWLEQQEACSVLYISLGSIAVLSRQQRRELAAGLKLSGVKFLWVIRKDEQQQQLSKAEKRLINNIVRKGEQEEAEDEGEGEDEIRRELVEAGQGMIVTWSPQLEVLFHSSVGGFVTHCGWNSTLEGAVSGKAMLCWPCLFDQNINSRLIAQVWGLGALLTRRSGDGGLVRRGDVAAAVQRVMSGGDEMRRRGAALSSRLTPGASPDLQRFVTDLLAG